MEAVICAIAKCENNYINDGVNYHLNLGFDKIYLFDNNDKDYEYVGDRIDQKDKVEIIDVRGIHKSMFQIECYDKFYHSHTFDGCAFIDIDEYIVLNNGNNIHAFLQEFSNFSVIRLNWQMYGDDGLITRDLDIPVNKFFKNRLSSCSYETHGKSIIRGNVPGLKIVSCHYCKINGKLPQQIMADKIGTTGEVGKLHKCNEAYINHYMTKTLSEFIDQKISRGTDACFDNKKIDFNYYGYLNDRTQDKLQYIGSKGL